MWISIERLKQGESLNKQDVKTNLCWEFGRFTSRDGQSNESYYSMFYNMMNDMVRNQLEVSTMQYQKEVSEIYADKIAKNANPLALITAAQQYPDTYYQAPKSYKSHAPPSKQSSYTRSYATTRNKGKEIAKLITPLSESASEEDEDSDLKQAQRDKEINKNVDNSPKNMNDNQTGQFRNQRTLTIVGARETVGNQLDDIDEEIDEQELEAHYSFMAKIQEVLTAESGYDVEPLEKVDSNVIPNSSDMCNNDNQADQNAKECNDERVVLANLIANLKLDNDEKKIQKQFKKVNTSLSHELQECKSALEECKSSLDGSNRTRDRYLGALHDLEAELAK
ncbi:hypothetical protein Tco_0789574 [Tanacetum coccineum]